MREIIEFRIPEENARRYLRPSIGVRLGDSVRKVVVATDDPLYARICEIDRRFRIQFKEEEYFFYGWHFHRRYTQAELDAAELFRIEIKQTFEPCGEDCGTAYDETAACTFCGVGAKQRCDLVLSARSLAKKRELGIARTIAGEIVVSDELVQLVESKNLIGAAFRPISQKGKGKAVLTGWQQLLETAHELRIVSPTKTGNGPTDDDPTGEYRCPRGHTIGLQLLSELWVSRHDFDKYEPDVAFTRQRIGVRRGLLRPNPELLVSARMREAIMNAELKGFGFEVAYLSNETDMPRRPANALVEREAVTAEDI